MTSSTRYNTRSPILTMMLVKGGMIVLIASVQVSCSTEQQRGKGTSPNVKNVAAGIGHIVTVGRNGHDWSTDR